MTRQKTITLCNNYCWVFITRENTPRQQLYIGLAVNLPQVFREQPERDILYYRQFATTAEGLGHKLYLAQVEKTTLWQTIRGMNPAAEDLRKEFYKEL